jgi:hypothetical protein
MSVRKWRTCQGEPVAFAMLPRPADLVKRPVFNHFHHSHTPSQSRRRPPPQPFVRPRKHPHTPSPIPSPHPSIPPRFLLPHHLPQPLQLPQRTLHHPVHHLPPSSQRRHHHLHSLHAHPPISPHHRSCLAFIHWILVIMVLLVNTQPRARCNSFPPSPSPSRPPSPSRCVNPSAQPGHCVAGVPPRTAPHAAALFS